MTNKVLILFSLLFMLSAVGCSTEPLVITKYEEVYIPVKTELEAPDRPPYLYQDTAITYVLKILEYAETLETIIYIHNIGVETNASN